jgi:hypothetical protein
MEPETSLTQEAAICPYSEPERSSPCQRKPAVGVTVLQTDITFYPPHIKER